MQVHQSIKNTKNKHLPGSFSKNNCLQEDKDMLRRKAYDPKSDGKPSSLETMGKKVSDLRFRLPSISGVLIIILVGYIIVDRVGRNWGTDNVKLTQEINGKIIDEVVNDTHELNPKIKGVNDFKFLHPIHPGHIDDPQEKEFIKINEYNNNLKKGEPPKIAVFDPNLHIQEKHQKLDALNPNWKDKVIHPSPKEFPVELLKVPSLTCDKPITLLILVHTLTNNFGARKAIRETWGIQNIQRYDRLGNDVRWKTIFVLGKMSGSGEIQVTTESQEYGDILQGDFMDNDYEDTRKIMLAMKWLPDQLSTCQPKYILKTGDNIFHNMFSIMDWIDAKFPPKTQDIYMGRLLKLDRPIRDMHDPMYVSMDDYNREFFPDMIRGPEYLFDTNTYKKLAGVMSYVTPLAIEDGYIGLLAERAGIKPTHNDHFQMLERTSNECHTLRLFFVYKVTAFQHIVIFNANRVARKSNLCLNAKVYGKDMQPHDIVP